MFSLVLIMLQLTLAGCFLPAPVFSDMLAEDSMQSAGRPLCCSLWCRGVMAALVQRSCSLMMNPTDSIHLPTHPVMPPACHFTLFRITVRNTSNVCIIIMHSEERQIFIDLSAFCHELHKRCLSILELLLYTSSSQN